MAIVFLHRNVHSGGLNVEDVGPELCHIIAVEVAEPIYQWLHVVYQV